MGRQDANLDRVRAILKMIHANHILDHINHYFQKIEEGHEHHMLHVHSRKACETLSNTEVAKLHLARALIMNPEILILQRPLSYHDHPDECKKILDTIIEHNKNRGVELPKDTVHRRRP